MLCDSKNYVSGLLLYNKSCFGCRRWGFAGWSSSPAVPVRDLIAFRPIINPINSPLVALAAPSSPTARGAHQDAPPTQLSDNKPDPLELQAQQSARLEQHLELHAQRNTKQDEQFIALLEQVARFFNKSGNHLELQA